MLDELGVHVDDAALDQESAVGVLRRAGARGRRAVSFTFDERFLARNSALILDPYPGDQYSEGGELFGIFTDAAPDRWGRYLLQRREAALARHEGRAVRQ